MAKQTEEQKAAAAAKRAAANAEKKAQDQATETEEQKTASGQVHEETEIIEEGKVRVIPLLNIICKDGVYLEAGKPAIISESEYERLKEDTRGPFFKE